MNVKETKLPGVLVLEPDVFSDERGFFLETWNAARYGDIGIHGTFVQDNVSFSRKDILRGLHFQYPQSQGKLIQVLSGEVLDVAVDIRAGSPTFGQWVGEVLSETNHKQMYVPPGFAHGYCVTSQTALFSYKCTDFYNSATENGIVWNDPDIGIDWPVAEPILSSKDAGYTRLKDLQPEKLPQFEDLDGN
ncbi:MAG: dTDP-4-dehydrorhamnose 3,5-epimerase [Planctomycetes bacterium B3_Pla]|nr:MAG: dTDP-4-dehydrorhamnose 3,5-epimerase [Planctomycetes bacterium B3_Pla]